MCKVASAKDCRDDVLINQKLVSRVVNTMFNCNGTVLYFNIVSDDLKAKVRDNHVINIIDNHFNADEMVFISLAGCTGITDAVLEHIAQKCTRMKELDVNDCVNITDRGIKAVVKKIGNNLTQLYYNNCNRCSNAALQAVVQFCANLNELGAIATTVTQIPKNIGQDLPKLTKLFLNNNKIKKIPPSITLLFCNELEFCISGNRRLQDPPLKIAARGMDAICEYFIDKHGLKLEKIINDDAQTDDDGLVNQELIDKVKLKGTMLLMGFASDDLREKLRDKHIINIIDKHFKADEVKNISLYGCARITDATLEHIAQKCTQLEVLALNDCVNITDDGIQAAVEKIGINLKKLEYDGCKLSTDASLEAIVEHCPNLTELSAKDNGLTQIPNTIGRDLPKLLTLNLCKNEIQTIPPSITLLLGNSLQFLISDNPLLRDPPTEIADQGMEAICEYFIETQLFNLINASHDDDDDDDDDILINEELIEAVSFNSGTVFSTEMLSGIEELLDKHIIDIINNHFTASAIKHICLEGCTSITDATLRHIAQKCPKLEVLSVKLCENITDYGIKVVVETKIGINLVIFNYSGCSECSNAAFEAIVKNCPNLQTLSAMKTSITQIPHTFGQDLPKLSRLYLDLNDIKTIPPSIILLHGNELDFRIFDNHNLQYPPLCIAYQGMDAICKFIANNELEFSVSGNHLLQDPPLEIADQGMDAICANFIDKRGIDKKLVGDLKEFCLGTGLALYFPVASENVRKKLRDDHVIDIIENHFEADEVIHISLNGCAGITDATLEHIAEKCTQLQQLDLNDCVKLTDDGIQAIVELIGDNLNILRYNGCNRCTNTALEAIVEHCPNLQELQAKDTGLTQIPRAIGQELTKLSILDLSSNNIKSIPPSITLLAVNYLNFTIFDNPLLQDPTPEIADQGMGAICEYIVQAYGVTLNYDADAVADDDGLIDKDLIDKVRYDWGTVFNADELSDELRKKLRDKHVISMIDNYFKAEKITSIIMNDVTGITDATLRHIANKCTNLTVLIVGSCTQLTDDGIKAVAETKIGKNLSTLSYSLCSGCTDAAFQAVVQHCPNLESLGAAGTGVKQIPETIGQDLPKLNKLWLHKNDIKIIPTSITLLLNNKLQFLIYDNPIEDPPPNIVKEGMESICVWLYRKRKMCKLLRKVTNEHKGKSTSVALFRPWGSEKALLYNLTKKEEQKNLETLNSTGTVIDAVTK